MISTTSPTLIESGGLPIGGITIDFDNDTRSSLPDIGADEFEGFQYVNDLAVQVITRPGGITDNAGVITVTSENPLPIQAIVKNQGSIKAFNRNVYSKVETSTDNGTTAPESRPAAPPNTGMGAEDVDRSSDRSSDRSFKFSLASPCAD